MKWELNRYQKTAVEHVEGPCLVTSCPGSGKTFVLVERIIRLINNGIKPKNILCLTFTNKAANEMKERVCKKLNKSKPGFFIGTFHSLCSLLIRKLGSDRGYSANFSILDENDQRDLIMQVSRRLEYKIEYGDSRYIAHCLNYYRDQMEDFDWVEDNLTVGPKTKIAKKYIERCKKNNLIDFSGLIYETIQLLENNDDIKNKVQNTFKYIMVDETQDTNKAQFYLINLLGDKWKNIMLIGDIDQCVTGDSLISTPAGNKKASSIKENDIILCGKGKGVKTEGIINGVHRKEVNNYEVVEVETEKGKKATFSAEHIMFADYVKKSPKKIIVYLMYDNKLGYRVGVTNTKRNGRGIGERLQQERADHIWILKAVDDIGEAKYWEQFYSIKYGIPTWCFYAKNRNMDYTDNNIKKLFDDIDTRKNARFLMQDLLLYEDRPHFIPKCQGKNKRRNFTIVLCGEDRASQVAHRYNIHGSEIDDKEKLRKLGFHVRQDKRGRRGWRVESSKKDLFSIYSLLYNIQRNMDINVIEKARLTDHSLSFIPASHLREGMAIFIETEKGIDIDIIKKVKLNRYTGFLYDFDVKNYHNFINNGIVSHNSIYGWRGARYQNIQDFMNTYTNCRVISLSKNYRSTPQIINKASKLIKFNSSHLETRFETNNNDGEHVRCYKFKNQLVEADWVGVMVSRLINEGGWEPKDMAVLYRANKMSEPIERAMVNRGIPYEVIGSWNFYDRREIRDCIAMLKFLSNNRDGIAFNRLCGLIRGMGKVTIGRIENMSQEEDISIIDACKKMKKQAKSVNIKRACEKINSIYDFDWDMTNPALCLKRLIDKFNYRKYLSNKFSGSATEREDNTKQLIDSAGEFKEADGVNKYLQQTSLISKADKENKDNKISLMSLHASKGLEFPIIFMIGVEENILPHKNALADDPYAGLEEERRLCYVGMTRAKKILFTSWCRKRRRFGKYGNMTTNKSKPSKFLKEADLIEDEEWEQR